MSFGPGAGAIRSFGSGVRLYRWVRTARSVLSAIIMLIAAASVSGCSRPMQGPDQAERDSWSRVIESAIQALPGVADASHKFQYHRYGDYSSGLDVRLKDNATAPQAEAVVRVMATQQLPPQYRGDSTVLKMVRMTDSYFASWRFGGDTTTKAEAANTWARVSATRPGAEIHWSDGGTYAANVEGPAEKVVVAASSGAEPSSATAAMRKIAGEFPELAARDWTVASGYHDLSIVGSSLGPDSSPSRRTRFPSGSELELWEWVVSDQPFPYFADIRVYDPPGMGGRTLGIAILPPAGKVFSAEQAAQLAGQHLPRLARSGAVVEYTLRGHQGFGFEVLVGGCPGPGRKISAEAEPFIRLYERC